MSTKTQVGNNKFGKGGFQERPQDRGRGFWKLEDTPRYKLEQMMKMPMKELLSIALDEDAPLFERKIAKCLADGDWKTVKEMIAEVYGTPKQSMDLTSGGDKIKTVVEIIDARNTNTDTN